MINKRNLKEERGITLLALIISIIILVILALITINSAYMSGIIQFGVNGAKDYAQSAIEENRIMEETEGYIESVVSTIKEKLGEGEKTLVEAFKEGKIKVGDYLDYNPVSSQTYTAKADKTGLNRINGPDQTFSTTNNNDLQWRVLGLSENEESLLLISEKPIKSDRVVTENDPYFYMYGANAYEYGIDELNNICAIFNDETFAQETRSITMDDINKALKIETDEDIKKYDLKQRVDGQWKSLYKYPYRFENQYTPAMWLEEQAQILANPQKTEEITGTKKGLVEGIINGYMLNTLGQRWRIPVRDSYLETN